MFDFSEYAGKLIAVSFYDDQDLVSLAEFLTLNGSQLTQSSIAAIQRRIRTERKYPYAVAVRVSTSGKAEWAGWCDTKWYEDSGYHVVGIDEVLANRSEDFSDLEFPLLL